MLLNLHDIILSSAMFSPLDLTGKERLILNMTLVNLVRFSLSASHREKKF